IGLTPTDYASGFWAEFDVAGATFGIGNFEQVGKPGSGASLALEVDDIAATYARLTDRGVTVSAPHELPNCSLSVVRDPDGNQIWLHQKKRDG
ncbi:MAG: VOC family protein, partial [Vulcanimicrobiaceae bacterium]